MFPKIMNKLEIYKIIDTTFNNLMRNFIILPIFQTNCTHLKVKKNVIQSLFKHWNCQKGVNIGFTVENCHFRTNSTFNRKIRTAEVVDKLKSYIIPFA